MTDRESQAVAAWGDVSPEPRVARLAAEYVLGTCFGLVTKRIDVTTPAGFDRVVDALAQRLRTVSAGTERAAIRAALDTLDVDWSRTLAADRRRIVQAALGRAGRLLAMVPTALGADLGAAAHEVVASTRSAVRRRGRLAIGVAPNALDRRVTAFLVRSETLFVTDATGRRLDGLGRRVREIVAAGVAAGRDRRAIAAELADATKHELVGRTPHYWDVVAGAFVARARAHAQVAAYAEAGVERFRVVAVLDEHTSDVCRFLHGQVVTVAAALRTFERAERLRDPDELRRAAPWVRRRGGALIVDHTSGEHTLAQITRSGVGARDDVGEFEARVAGDRLATVGIGMPPYHGLCRSGTEPVV